MNALRAFLDKMTLHTKCGNFDVSIEKRGVFYANNRAEANEGKEVKLAAASPQIRGSAPKRARRRETQIRNPPERYPVRVL